MNDHTDQLDIAQIRDDAARAERLRIAGVLDHAEAAGRQKLARALAFGTDLSPDAAAVILGVAEKDRPPFKSIGERALESAEPGMDFGGPVNAKEEAEARRKRVVEAANAQSVLR